jgi:biopolymer transport protein ExbD
MHLNEHADDNSTELYDINLTPLIDVMMVLLIIFMVAAPLTTVSIQVNLPVSGATPPPGLSQSVFLTINAEQQLYVNDKPVDRAILADALEQITEKNKETTIFVRADRTLNYQALMEIMDSLRQSGYHKVGLVGLGAASETP